MAQKEHLQLLRQGVEAWNVWRKGSPKVNPNIGHVYDLSDADLKGVTLTGADLTCTSFLASHLRGAKLDGANFHGSDLSGTQLDNATLTNTFMIGAHFAEASLRNADLSGANLMMTDFSHTDLTGVKLIGVDLLHSKFDSCQLSNADLSSAKLHRTTFNDVIVEQANFTKAAMIWTTFASINLSNAIGLDTVIHQGPSTIGIDTLYKSGGRVPEVFLRGCGVPENFIPFVRAHIGAEQVIQFYSCFISYSHKDEEFARRLCSRMRDEGLRVWFAPENMRAGEKLYVQVDRAIQIHDKLLIVLSEDSMQSEWVMTEIRNARNAEVEQKRRKLFPIRLASMEAIRKWKCFDTDSGKDLAIEVREYFVPDFSNWKDQDSFEAAFERLLKDLRSEEAKQPPNE